MKTSYKMSFFFAAGLITLIGCYNAVVVNSDSSLLQNSPLYSKRLDEVYGIKVPGREIAANWKKLENPIKAQPVVVKAQETNKEVAPTFQINDEAAIQNELSLKLVEVLHPTKWKNGLAQTEFFGSIEAKDGVIENLNIALPNGEGIALSFAEMKGNVFEYELNGEIYSGLMYQVDQAAFMVTLSNGPLEGTRLRFLGRTEQDASSELSFEEPKFVAGDFGNAAPIENEVSQEVAANTQEPVGFKL